MSGQKNKIVVEVPASVRTRLRELSHNMKESESNLTLEALENYLELRAWQKKEIENGLAEAKRGEFASEEKVNKFFEKWRTV